MKNVLLLVFSVLILIACKKENEEHNNISNDSTLVSKDYILAGDSLNFRYKNLNFSLLNYSNGSSIPSNYSISETSSEDIPINIDYDSILDIRYGYYIFYQNNYVVSKAFVISNNYGNESEIEFAVNPGKILNLRDSNYVVFLFSESDTINYAHKWICTQQPEMYIVSLNNSFELYFNNFKGGDTLINNDVSRKYIGIRKKIGSTYTYGWLRINVENCERMNISGSSFSYYYRKL